MYKLCSFVFFSFLLLPLAARPALSPGCGRARNVRLASRLERVGERDFLHNQMAAQADGLHPGGVSAFQTPDLCNHRNL
jgi:hypothetical protein